MAKHCYTAYSYIKLLEQIRRLWQLQASGNFTKGFIRLVQVHKSFICIVSDLFFYYIAERICRSSGSFSVHLFLPATNPIQPLDGTRPTVGAESTGVLHQPHQERSIRTQRCQHASA
ncbi:hypothetical protein ATANTOWER_018142 [Ataeniobius toweri]|uniref:Uncharacterized protein n=1 Tax=Ataeniobius toweri TaxID=208326 RepID=A0ABU7BSA5_9TELE|nr:hypothetical protein [Ataeniobius toweri]